MFKEKSYPTVPVHIVDDYIDPKEEILPPASTYEPQAPITRRGILPSFCNTGRTVEILEEDLVTNEVVFMLTESKKMLD